MSTRHLGGIERGQARVGLIGGLGGLGHPAWKDSAFGLAGLIVAAHLRLHGSRFVSPAEVAEWLGEDAKGAWKRLDRWAKRGGFCHRDGKRFIVHPPSDPSDADYMTGPDLMAQHRKVLDGYDKALRDFKEFQESDPTIRDSARNHPHYEAGRKALSEWLEDNPPVGVGVATSEAERGPAGVSPPYSTQEIEVISVTMEWVRSLDEQGLDESQAGSA